MQAVILAGGLGTRLGEETSTRPKPMVEIGGMPIIWHIMKIYSKAGVNDFVVCLGYKGYMIKEFFANYFLHTTDVTIDLQNNSVEVHQNWSEPWRITLVETGADTQTGGRLKAIANHLRSGQPFCFTYGDGVADIDVSSLIAFHEAQGKRATITAVAPPGRFGAIEFDGDLVRNFREKPAGDGGLINGGFFVADPSVLDLVDGPDTIWERGPLGRVDADGEPDRPQRHAVVAVAGEQRAGGGEELRAGAGGVAQTASSLIVPSDPPPARLRWPGSSRPGACPRAGERGEDESQ